MSRIDLPQGTLDRYYELPEAGLKQLETGTGIWKQLTLAVNQVLGEA
jgi:hypothetical protein